MIARRYQQCNCYTYNIANFYNHDGCTYAEGVVLRSTIGAQPKFICSFKKTLKITGDDVDYKAEMDKYLRSIKVCYFPGKIMFLKRGDTILATKRVFQNFNSYDDIDALIKEFCTGVKIIEESTWPDRWQTY